MPTYEHKGSVHVFGKKKEKRRFPGWAIALAVLLTLMLIGEMAG